MSSTPKSTRRDLTGRAFHRTAIIQPRLDTTQDEEDQHANSFSEPSGRPGLTNYLKCCCCPLMAVLYCDGCKDKFCRSCGPRLHQSIVALRGHPSLRILPRAEEDERSTPDARYAKQQQQTPVHQIDTSRSSWLQNHVGSSIQGNAKQQIGPATSRNVSPSAGSAPRGRQALSRLVSAVKEKVEAEELVRETASNNRPRTAMSPKQARQLYKRVRYDARERSSSPTHVYPRLTPSRGRSPQQRYPHGAASNPRWTPQRSAAFQTFMEEQQQGEEDTYMGADRVERTGLRRPNSPSVSFQSGSATPSRSQTGSTNRSHLRPAPQLIPVQDGMSRPRAITTPIRQAAKQVLAARGDENKVRNHKRSGGSTSLELNSTTNAHQLPLNSPAPLDTEEGEAALSTDVFYTVAAHSSFGSSPTKGGPTRRPIGHGLGVHSYISPSMKIYRNLPDFVPELTEGRREVDGWWKLNK
jgi:hypothetical protein